MSERLLEQVRNRRERDPAAASTTASITKDDPAPADDPPPAARTVPEQVHIHTHIHTGPTEPPVVHNHIAAPEIHLPEQPAPVVNIEHHTHVDPPQSKTVRAAKLEDGSTLFTSE